MSPSANWRIFGPWIPYPTPVPIPSSSIDEEPKSSICVNDEWVPYFTGALKVLKRPNTWDSDDAGVLADLRGQVDNVLSSWKEGCEPPIPNWQIRWSPSFFLATLFSYRPEYDAGLESTANTRSFVFGGRNPDPDNVSTDILIYFEDASNQDVGVHIDQININSWGKIGLGQIYGDDCLGSFFVGNFGSYYHFRDIYPSGKDLKNIQFSSTFEYWSIEVVGHGQWVCGVT